ncbi:hypothetical protein Vretimale_387 [Volvox reticuliferus]|uniref:Uncharacterized protein n=1 Tax=Volvox reticuliferus TaxID=1737510 RepID=A0A8J4CG23_9CHLO|nr:hypothetical protein Vretifemale_8106 [Volvox reticuliferus]GIL94053.1 hypothetical protein Vretimale_387 [Volvox reticuliferus]
MSPQRYLKMPHDLDEGPAAPARTISPDLCQARSLGTGLGGAGGGDDTAPAGAYNAQEYKHLNVPEDVRELFQYIDGYKPEIVELETKLKPFIPDYIPAVGGIDEFIKVPRPDGKPDYLGLKVLDEPAAEQSDPKAVTSQLLPHSTPREVEIFMHQPDRLATDDRTHGSPNEHDDIGVRR